MSIAPQIVGNSDQARLQQQLADLRRRVDRVGRLGGYIAPGSIEGGAEGHIRPASITTAEILAGTITAEDIAALTITTINLAAASVTAEKIAADSITGDKINVNTLSALTADMGALTAGTITLGGVGSYIRATPGGAARVDLDYLGIRAVNASNVEKFNFDATTGILTASAVISSETGSSIDTTHLAGAITTTQITDDSISTPKLKANSVVASKIFVASLSAISADLGTITAGLITAATVRSSSTNPKTQLDPTGLFTTDSTGAKTVEIKGGSTSGAIEISAASGSDPSVAPLPAKLIWKGPNGNPILSLTASRASDESTYAYIGVRSQTNPGTTPNSGITISSDSSGGGRVGVTGFAGGSSYFDKTLWSTGNGGGSGGYSEFMTPGPPIDAIAARGVWGTNYGSGWKPLTFRRIAPNYVHIEGLFRTDPGAVPSGTKQEIAGIPRTSANNWMIMALADTGGVARFDVTASSGYSTGFDFLRWVSGGSAGGWFWINAIYEGDNWFSLMQFGS